MLDSLAVCARFPEDSCNFALTAGDATEAVAAEEETANMLEKRQELFTLFRNTAKLAPEPAYAFVGTQLQGVVSHSKACWQVRSSTSAQLLAMYKENFASFSQPTKGEEEEALGVAMLSHAMVTHAVFGHAHRVHAGSHRMHAPGS